MGLLSVQTPMASRKINVTTSPAPQTLPDFVTRLRATYKINKVESEPEDVTTLRYVLYARQSTDKKAKKQERSIGDQVHECKALAERTGLNVVAVLHEEHSAKLSGERDVFHAMLESLVNNEYDAILTWAPDRLARNMKDAGEVLDLLDKNDIKDIKFANGYYFQNDGAGKMMLGIAFVQAKQFIDNHSQNIKRGITRITEEGKCYDRPKHGYYKDKDKYLRPDGENWYLIKKAFEMRLSREPQYALREIGEWLTKEGYPLKTKYSERKRVVVDEGFLSERFRDPFYAGALTFGKRIVDLTDKYNFKPIITPDEYDLLTKMSGISNKLTLAEVIKPKGTIKADLMRGMVICCGCNRPRSTGITPKKTKTGKTNYFLYRCDTVGCKYKGKSIRAKEVLAAAYAFLDSHPMNFNAGYEAYKHEMERQISAYDTELLSRLKSLNKRRETAKERIDEGKLLLKQYANDPILVKEFEKDLIDQLSKQRELEKEVLKLQKERDGGKDAIQSYEDFIELFGNLAQHIKKITNMDDLDYIMKKVFMNFVVEGKKVVSITQNSPFRELCGSPFGDGSP